MDQCQAFVKTVMNLKIPQHVGNFLPSWEIIICQIRTLLNRASCLCGIWGSGTSSYNEYCLLECDIKHTCQKNLKNMFYREDGGGVFLKALVPKETTYFCIPMNISRSSDKVPVVLVKPETCRSLIFLKLMLWIKWELCVFVD